MESDQTDPWEQSDLHPYCLQCQYCLQYQLSRNTSRREEQTNKVVTGEKRVSRAALYHTLQKCSLFPIFKMLASLPVEQMIFSLPV